MLFSIQFITDVFRNIIMSPNRVALLSISDKSPEMVRLQLIVLSFLQDRASSEVLDGMVARDNA